MHIVGASMSDGTISSQWWADWIKVLYEFHSVIDGPKDQDNLSRCLELEVDIKGCSVTPRYNYVAEELKTKLRISDRMQEAGRYVLTGAHLMGGAVTKKRIGGRLPTAHLQFGHRKNLMKTWTPYRQRVDLTEEARMIFQYLLWSMDEILLLDIGTSYKELEHES
jgi:hypothetical protein